LRNHDWDERLSFFSAYERLDNIDYIKLKKIAESFGCDHKALVFFNIHIHVDHHNAISSPLKKIWESYPKKIKTSFDFIKDHQAKIWKNISNTIFNYKDKG
jgi:hypothetical protein